MKRHAPHFLAGEGLCLDVTLTMTTGRQKGSLSVSVPFRGLGPSVPSGVAPALRHRS